MQGHLSGWQRGKARLRTLSCHLWPGSSWPWTSLWYKERPRRQQRHQTGVKTGYGSFCVVHVFGLCPELSPDSLSIYLEPREHTKFSGFTLIISVKKKKTQLRLC